MPQEFRVLVSGCDFRSAQQALFAASETQGISGYDTEPDLISVTVDANSGQDAVSRVRDVVGEDCNVRLAQGQSD
jgi:hypothetical protein